MHFSRFVKSLLIIINNSIFYISCSEWRTTSWCSLSIWQEFRWMSGCLLFWSCQSSGLPTADRATWCFRFAAFMLLCTQIQHILRCSPCHSHPSLETFDKLLKAGVCSITNCDLSDIQWLQASLSQLKMAVWWLARLPLPHSHFLPFGFSGRHSGPPVPHSVWMQGRWWSTDQKLPVYLVFLTPHPSETWGKYLSAPFLLVWYTGYALGCHGLSCRLAFGRMARQNVCQHTLAVIN